MKRGALLLFAVTVAVSVSLPAGAQGATPAVPITGAAEPGLSSFDTAIESMMKRYGIPGAALGVVHDGRLVYARGFGYANLSTHAKVQPDSLFRIASITKTFTQTAIEKLVEEKKLSLSDDAFRILALKPPPKEHVDPRVYRITIADLLQHRSGWIHDTTDDTAAAALGVKQPVSCEQLARYTLGRPLDRNPGTTKAYSNIGYCMLGLVIEKVSGESYAQFLQREILRPTGIHRTALGNPFHPLPGEVHYYAAPGEQDPYKSVYIRSDMSDGALVSSTVDLLRFLTSMNGTRGTRILSAPPDWKNFDLVYPTGGGWVVGVQGGFPGTRSILELDGENGWALLINTAPSQPSFENDGVLYSALAPVVKKIGNWPDADLFSRFR